MTNKWYVVINPTSGNGAAKKKWPAIYTELNHQNFNFEYAFTTYAKHSIVLIQNALKQGYTKLICVGGDGTIHNFVNAVLSLNLKNINDIKIGIIPIGTGNDWVKTYNISKNYKEAIKTIKAEKTIFQDIGKIQITDNKKIIYFNNLAGIGFDGYVVNKVHRYKNLGFLAYFFGAIVSLTSYKRSNLKISLNNTVIKSKTLMLLIGLCKYSGGGMQLTQNPDATDGLFDITFVESITLFTILTHIKGLFNGSITKLNCVKNFKSTTISIYVLDSQETYIQADGEIIGSGNFSVSILPKALQFIVA
jgi:YegS/Rv2252/BmrU family lipid kinase